jgi:hypothetical protein
MMHAQASFVRMIRSDVILAPVQALFCKQTENGGLGMPA